MSLSGILRTLAPALFFWALMLAMPLHARTLDTDSRAAVIFAYGAVREGGNPSLDITPAQFQSHVDEILRGNFNVLPLSRIIDAFEKGKKLPPRTLALTFEGADRTLLDILPLLERYNLPFTVFVPAARIDSGVSEFLSWDDLQTIKDTGLAEFGVHPARYNRLSGKGADSIRSAINASIAALRENLRVRAEFFAYPFGEYDESYREIVRQSGFRAAFGAQSGVAHAGGDRFALPRFVLSERYGDADRFVMTANALPLPAVDISPGGTAIHSASPAIGFTVTGVPLKSLSCFASAEQQPDVDILGNRVEIRLAGGLKQERTRVNCTLPVAPEGAEEEPRYRWLGFLLISPMTYPESEDSGTESDFVNAE